MNLSEMTLLKTAGIAEGTALASVVATRRNIVEMTQKAEDAVLRPKDFGAFSHPLRAAIAARVARRAMDEELTQYYISDAGPFANLAAPDETGADHDLTAVLSFVDRVADQTRDVSADDISALQDRGVADADIVRLCELVAFLAYQLRVISGLRLMKGDSQ